MPSFHLQSHHRVWSSGSRSWRATASGRPCRALRCCPVASLAASGLPSRTRLSRPRLIAGPSSYRLPGSRRGLPYPAKTHCLLLASCFASSPMRCLVGSPCCLPTPFSPPPPPRTLLHAAASQINAFRFLKILSWHSQDVCSVFSFPKVCEIYILCMVCIFVYQKSLSNKMKNFCLGSGINCCFSR
jgi:hypothetical protein